ncbi:MAG: polysaccharide biosynthesis/export family protein [Paracoccaceae bacterium]
MKFRAVRLGLILGLGMLVAACQMPRSGPSAAEILSGSVENGGSMHVVLVNDRVASAAYVNDTLGFTRAFLNAGVASVSRINPGDLLNITIWENIENGLLVAAGTNSIVLPAVQVDELGNIFVPYAGTISASGRTPDELREEITRELARQTPDPQVEVRRQAGDGATVSVVGPVGRQGVFPLENPNRRLTGMLAVAGGVQSNPGVTQITVQRGGQSGRIWLEDLYANTDNDIPLRAGDRIIVEENVRYFTALGAANKQAQLVLGAREQTVIDGLAAIGGLNGNAANPRGIFILRTETAEIANRVLQRNDLTTPQRIAYVVDLTAPEGLFIAQEFYLRDRDSLFASEANYVAWGRFLDSLSNGIGAIADIARIVEIFE